MKLLIVEDNDRLRDALALGLENTGSIKVTGTVSSGEAALNVCLHDPSDVDAVLMDVHLAGAMNGIEAVVSLRRELPRFPVVFYSIQDDDRYYRDFRRSGILSHYAYVRKSNYLLPELIVPLVRDAIAGRSFIDPEIEQRVQEVRQKDELSPMSLLEPNERVVAQMLAAGMTNKQIAARLGFQDKRTVSRTNGQIYAAWGLADSTVEEKVARTRAALIVREGRLIRWADDGSAQMLSDEDRWLRWEIRNEAIDGQRRREP